MPYKHSNMGSPFQRIVLKLFFAFGVKLTVTDSAVDNDWSSAYQYRCVYGDRTIVNTYHFNYTNDNYAWLYVGHEFTD